jgi:hypothetical protein
MVTDQMVIDAKQKLNDLLVANWQQTDLFHFNWFFMIGFILASYILFFILVDKKRVSKILLFGCLATVGAFVYDVFGSTFVMWAFPAQIFPINPGIFMVDLTVVPIYLMLLYQYTHTWPKFLIWSAVYAVFFSLAFLNLLSWLGIYKAIKLPMIWNAPFVFVIACVARLITIWLVSIEQRKKEGFSKS